MNEGLEDEQYESNGYHPERIYTEHTVDELGPDYQDAIIDFAPELIQIYSQARKILEREGVAWQTLVLEQMQGIYGDETDTNAILNRMAIDNGIGHVVLSKYFYGDAFVEVQTDLEQKLTKVI